MQRPNDQATNPPFGSTALGLTLLTLASAVYVGSLALNHDAALYLLGARALQEGRVLYQTFPDYSFPANMWLAQLSLHLATWLHVVPALVHTAALFAAECAAIVLSIRLLDRILPPHALARAWNAPLLFVVFVVYPSTNAGQRDVLFGVWVAPLMLVALSRTLQRPPSATIARVALVFAVAGAALKPHFIAVLGLLALCDWVIRPRPWRDWLVDWLPGGLAICLYLAIVQIAYPHYFSEVLPTAAHSYGRYALGNGVMLSRSIWTVLLGLLAALSLGVVYLQRHRAGLAAPWRLAVGWGLVALVLTLLFFLQHQGFGYHRCPASFFFLLTIGLCALFVLEAWLPAPRRRWASAVVATCLLATVAIRVVLPASALTLRAAWNDPLTVLLRALPAKTPVLMLETGVTATSPLTSYADIRWTGEYGSLVELGAIVQDRDAATAARRPRDPVLVRLETDLRHRMLGSFTPLQPAIVLVNSATGSRLRWFEGYSKPFKILAFFQEDASFNAAFSAYQRVGSVGAMDSYTYDVYRRRGAPLAPLPGLGPSGAVQQ